MYFMKSIVEFLANEEGTTAIEYGLIAALISVAAIAAMTAVGGSLTGTFTKVSNSLSGAAR
jgi:pilus assembly protein Flp/PilA